MKARLAWAAFIAGGVLADLWRSRVADGSTLSQTTRDVFHTDTPLGRAAFLAAWGYLCAWFPGHILDQPAKDRRTP